MSLIGDERIINLQRTKVYVFSDSVLFLGKIHQNPECNTAWEERIGWITTSQSYRNLDRIDGEPMEFEWNIFPGLDTLQLCGKVKSLLSRLGETPENFQEEFYLCRCSTTFPLEQETMNKNVWQTLESSPYLQRSLVLDNGHLLVHVLRKSGTPSKKTVHKESGTKLAEKMLLEFAESGCPIFRATSPLARGPLKSKGHGKLSIHFAAVQETIETIFRIIVSANQLSLYGAVAEMCEECETPHDRSGRPDVVMGQSIVLSAIKTEVPLENDDPANQNFLLQQYEERIGSYHNKTN